MNISNSWIFKITGNSLYKVIIGIFFILFENSICYAQPDSLIYSSSIKAITTSTSKLELSEEFTDSIKSAKLDENICFKLKLTGNSYGSVELISYQFPNDYWQKVVFDPLDVTVDLEATFRNEDADFFYYTIPKRSGSIHFKGKATFKNFGATEELDFNAAKNFNHEGMADGLIKYSKKDSKITYINLPLSKNSDYYPPKTDYPNAYNLTYAPNSISVNFEFPSVWWFKPPNDDVFDVPEAKLECYNPTANFTYEDAGKEVNTKWDIIYWFKDNSSPGVGQTIKEYLWEFGDGKTSTEKDPIHTYEKAGNYTVSLTVTNFAGDIDKRTIENCVSDIGFRPHIHGWIINNSNEDLMWSESYWYKFRYYTYSNDLTWLRKFMFIGYPPSNTFPDWPLFVEVYGNEYCYLGNTTKREALEKWNSIRDKWGGVCFGFSISSLLFFNNYLDLNKIFPSSYSLYISHDIDKSINLINKYFLYQFDYRHMYWRNMVKYNSVNFTVSQIRKSFNSVSENIAIDIAQIQNRIITGWHSIVPYKIITNTNNLNEILIYIYDNNHPGNQNSIITVNNGLWFYPGFSSGYSDGFFNRQPISGFTIKPELKKGMILSQFQILNSNTNDLLIIKNNESIGYSQGNFYEKTSYGISIEIAGPLNSIPRPKGYFINLEEYKTILDNFESETTSFSVFSDTISFFYDRSNTTFEQKDILLFGPNYIKVVNPDKIKKSFNFMCIFNQPEYEKVFEFNDVEISPGDTISYYFSNSSEVKMETLDSATTYNFRANILTQTKADFYPEKKVSAGANTIQTVIPSWNDINNEGVLLRTDNGSDGTIDETLNLNNLTGLSIFDKKLLVSVYPNPSQGKFKIECNENVSIAFISVFDMYGRKIMNYQLNNQQRKWTSEVDLSQFSKGAYLLKIVTDKKVFEKILIKN